LLSFAELRDKAIHEIVKSINATPIAPPFQPIQAPMAADAPRGRGCGRGNGRGRIQIPQIQGDNQNDSVPHDKIEIEPVIPEVVKITHRSARRLCGLVYWVKDRMRRGVQVDPYLFDEASLIDALQEEEGEDLADNVDVKLPDKFTPDKWVQWEIEFTNYLGT
jgi:hypothetical protein